ncbi:DUF4339 domain-containing protein [Clostridium saccharobutylicum]|uniref:GYF domain-containing protein n=1 Tax=Clostridium saccharobutylicum TaxID=169679 RepID=A0A1S8N3R1_CLOSA|nr:DUF4339 domain-containing protein [Clostridium saccharobutylicum]OOM11146.1 hypothetical protein CLOSAC_26890 [Clostridium saccharobutylicum]
MGNELRYKESIKKAYISGQITSSKTREILNAKAKLFNIDEDQAKAIEDNIISTYSNLENLIIALSNDNRLSYQEFEEIKSISKDLDIEESEVDDIITKLGFTIIKYMDNNKIERMIENNCKVEKESNFKIIEDIKIEYPKDTNKCKHIIYFNEGVEKAYINFTQTLYEIKNKDDFNFRYIKEKYEDTVVNFIKEYYTYLLQNKFIAQDGIEMVTFMNSVSAENVIKNFLQAINELNSNSEYEIQAFKNNSSNSFGNNSIMVGNILQMATYNIGAQIFNGLGSSIQNAHFKSEIDKKIYNHIVDAIPSFIEMCVSTTINNFIYGVNILFRDNIREQVEEIINNKEKAKSLIENLKLTRKTNSADENLNLILESIKLYPFIADEYLQLLKILNIKNNSSKLELLQLAYDNLVELNEEEKIIEAYNEIIQKEYCKKLHKYIRNIISIEEINDFKQMYNLKNDAILALAEYSELGKFISNINFDNIDEGSKKILTEQFFIKNKTKNIDEVRKKLADFQRMCCIGKCYFDIELERYGTILSNLNLQDYTIEKKQELLVQAYNSIKKMEEDDDFKITLIKDIRSILNLNKKYVLEEEMKLFGKLMSATQEDETWIKRKQKMLNLYDLFYDIMRDPFGDCFSKCTDKNFTTGRVLNDVITKMRENDDEPIFSCLEKTLVFTPKQGFVISLKSISSYMWDRLILIQDIHSIEYEEEKFVNTQGDISCNVSIRITTLDGRANRLNGIYYLKDMDGFCVFLVKCLQYVNPNIIIIDKTDRLSEVLDNNIHLTTDGTDIVRVSYIDLLTSDKILKKDSEIFAWKEGLKDWMPLKLFLKEMSGENKEESNINENAAKFEQINIDFKGKQIYLGNSEETFGPYQEDEIVNVLYRKGFDPKETYIWYEGLENWMSMNEHLNYFIML